MAAAVGGLEAQLVSFWLLVLRYVSSGWSGIRPRLRSWPKIRTRADQLRDPQAALAWLYRIGTTELPQEVKPAQVTA